MTAVPAALRIPRVRWGIGVLLGAGVLINYFDRINLSVGAPQLQQEFGLTDGELGWLFSGFFWSYALLQIPTGMILDRFGVTSVYRVSAVLWSIASGATAFAGGFGGILAARLVLGVAEGPHSRRVPRPPVTGFRGASGQWQRQSLTPLQSSPTSSLCRWLRWLSCSSAGDGASALLGC